MISIRVKTQALELEVSTDSSQNLSDVGNELIKLAQSDAIQQSIQTPILLRDLPSNQSQQQQELQLPLFNEAVAEKNSNNSKSETRPKANRIASGRGEEAQANNKIMELIPLGYFDQGRDFAEITTELSKLGYNITAKRLANALLRVVRKRFLVREGQRGSYKYKKATAINDSAKPPQSV